MKRLILYILWNIIYTWILCIKNITNKKIYLLCWNIEIEKEKIIIIILINIIIYIYIKDIYVNWEKKIYLIYIINILSINIIILMNNWIGLYLCIEIYSISLYIILS